MPMQTPIASIDIMVTCANHLLDGAIQNPKRQAALHPN
jgi:hypothetical protein